MTSKSREIARLQQDMLLASQSSSAIMEENKQLSEALAKEVSCRQAQQPDAKKQIRNLYHILPKLPNISHLNPSPLPLPIMMPQETTVSKEVVDALNTKNRELEAAISTLAGDKKGLELLIENLSNELVQKKDEAAMLRQQLASMTSTEVHLHRLLREAQVQGRLHAVLPLDCCQLWV